MSLTAVRKTRPLNLISTVCLAYALLTFFFFPEIFSKVYIGTGDDWCQYYSRMFFFKRWIGQGILPVWNPDVLTGLPAALDAVTDFSLRNFFVLFMTVDAAWNATLFTTAWASGFLMYLVLGYGLRLSGGAAFLGGLSFLLYSLDTSADNMTLFLMPGMFFLAHQWLKTRGFRWLFGLTLAAAYYFLNSNPQFVLYFCLFLAAYLMIHLKGMEKMMAAVPFAWAAGLCLFQVLPIYELLSNSNRAEVGDHIAFLFPLDLVKFLYPYFELSSADPALNFIRSILRKGVSFSMLGENPVIFVNPPYLGIFPFFSAVLMYFKRRRSLLENFLLYFCAGIVLYLVLNPLIFQATRHIPVLNQLPHIQRAFNLLYFTVPVLTALALHTCCFGPRVDFQSDFAWEKFGLFLNVVTGLFLGFMLLKTAAWAAVSLPAVHVFLKEKILVFVHRQSFYRLPAAFYESRADQMLAFLRGWLSHENLYHTLPSVFTGIALLGFRLLLRGRIPRTGFLFLFVAVSLLDGRVHFSKKTKFIPRELKPLAGEASLIKQDTGLFRVMPLQQETDPASPALIDRRSSDTRNVLLRPETNLIYGLSTPEGYRPLLPARYVRFIPLLTGEPPHGWQVGEFQRLDGDVADLMNIKYIITPAGRKMGDGYTLVYSNRLRWVYSNHDAAERAFLVHEAEVTMGGEEALSRMKKRGFDLKKRVILEEDSGLPEGLHQWEETPVQKVSVLKYTPQQIDIETASTSQGILVLTDAYYPGWKVLVDRRPAALLRADYAFRAVRLPPGSHRVEFRYQPESWRIGVLASVVFLLGGLAVRAQHERNKKL